MSHLVFVTQVVDPEHPVLGFVIRWIEALAARADRLTVIGNEVAPAGREALAGTADVLSLGKERGAGRIQRTIEYQRVLARLARTERPAGLLAHMCPEYLVLAAPIARASRIRTVLWFAHPSVTPQLRAADALADAIVTSLPGAYPIASPKVHVIGQATNTAALTFEPPSDPGRSLDIAAVGRTSPTKGFDVVIRAVGLARERGLAARAAILGPSTTEAERRHRVELELLIASLGLQDAIEMEAGVPHRKVPDALRSADLLANAMVTGSGDKVVFEAGALGRPVVVSNTAFSKLLEDLPLPMLFREGDPSSLADRFVAYAALSGNERRAIAQTLRERIEREHSLDHWADAVSEVLASRRLRERSR